MSLLGHIAFATTAYAVHVLRTRAAAAWRRWRVLAPACQPAAADR